MATIFIVLVLAVLVLNAVIMRSTTPWWRDPGSLFRRNEEPEAEVPAADPAAADPTRAADWVTAARARAAEMARARAAAPPARPENRRAADPRDLAPRRSAEVPPASPQTGESRHAMRSDEPMTDVFARIPDEEAPTQLLAQVTAGYSEDIQRR